MLFSKIDKILDLLGSLFFNFLLGSFLFLIFSTLPNWIVVSSFSI